jgi:mRNA interferase MazF
VVKGGAYVPDRGDAIWLSFDPQAGREQARRRPALVLSPASHNAKAGLAVVCPITSKAKGYPFETPLPSGLPIQGVVLSDRMRSLDWQARRAEKICDFTEAIVEDVTAKIAALIGTDK